MGNTKIHTVFLFLSTGGWIGYHIGRKEASGESCGWHRWWDHSRWQHGQQGRMAVPAGANPEYRGSPSYGGPNERPISTSESPQISPNDYAAFQAWKQQQQQPQQASTAQPQPNLTAEALKAGAMENADRALDVLLSQIQGLKEVSGDANEPGGMPQTVSSNVRLLRCSACRSSPPTEARCQSQAHPLRLLRLEQESTSWSS